jgi:2-polyprenyl-6-methoxyphenol hydroxylase-like FAD-dependent oxidoreductase
MTLESRRDNAGPVLIAGAGPVGLMLAADLAWRGIASIVVDPQVEVVAHPRAISIGVRSMEHFQRLGLDQKVIAAGVPRGQALDVVYVTRMLGREIFRFSIPSIHDLETQREALAQQIPEIAASPYFKTWTAQAPLERVLREHLLTQPLVDLRLGWRLDSFVETQGQVEAVITAETTGETVSLCAPYLVGCDGARSVVRTQLGIALEGRGTLGSALGLYFRAPALQAALGSRAGVMYWPLAPGCGGTLYTINGGDEWVFNRYFAAGEAAHVEDPIGVIKAAIGRDMEVELISALDWQPRQLVAKSYGTERVFLAGDACHLFVPTGGLGMNTGIGDAADLAWKIEAVLKGWGGPRLLSTYESERRPQGLRNTLEAADNYARSNDISSAAARVEEDGARGEAARSEIAARLPPKIKHFAPIGVHLGYRYEGSEIIEPDGTAEPAQEPANYVATARPGHRAPHLWLGPNRSTLDLFGRGFVLLVFGNEDTSEMEEEARKRSLPLSVARLGNAQAAKVYERRLVLVRPDGHVAWRADEWPVNIGALLDKIRGADLP